MCQKVKLLENLQVNQIQAKSIFNQNRYATGKKNDNKILISSN